MPEGTSRSRATAFVVNSLAVKAQTVAEIQAKLAKRGVSSGDAAAVVDDALRLGYLDDAALAEQLARGFVARGYGRRRAVATLRRRGLAALIVDAALDAAYGESDEVELARRALGRRPTTDAAERRRAAAFLARRGFSSAAAWDAIRSTDAG